MYCLLCKNCTQQEGNCSLEVLDTVKSLYKQLQLHLLLRNLLAFFLPTEDVIFRTFYNTNNDSRMIKLSDQFSTLWLVHKNLFPPCHLA